MLGYLMLFAEPVYPHHFLDVFLHKFLIHSEGIHQLVLDVVRIIPLFAVCLLYSLPLQQPHHQSLEALHGH